MSAGRSLTHRYFSRLFEKDTVRGRALDNLYTGYKLGKTGKPTMWGIAGIMGLSGMYSATQENRMNNTLAAAPTEDIMALPSTTHDYTRYQAQLPTNTDYDNSFGSTGDLVFALHKIRHGG
jgi:hypothetical protein